MNKLLFLLALFLFFPHPSHAATQSKIKDAQGNIMGTVSSYQKDGYFYTDYDFDEPYDCKLKSITTSYNNTVRTYTSTSTNGNTLDSDLGTYIAPRDAVLAFRLARTSALQSKFSSTLKFNCDSGTLTASVNKTQPTITPTRRPTSTPTPVRYRSTRTSTRRQNNNFPWYRRFFPTPTSSFIHYDDDNDFHHCHGMD